MKAISCFVVVIAVFCSGVSIANAAATTYDFSDPKKVNAVSITVSSMLEPTAGYADSISGSITFDHTSKKILKGNISIPTKNVTMTNATMTRVLHSKDWLNQKKYPTITFVFDKVIAITNKTEAEYKVTVKGALTIKGVTKEISAPVSLFFYPGKLGNRNKGATGDLARLQTEIKINRKDFQIKPEMPFDVVGEKIRLILNIAGGVQH